MMVDKVGKLKDLSPEKRALLERLLKKKAKAKQEASRIHPRPNQDEYPLSYAQQRMWFLYTLEPDSPYYNIPAALRLWGRLDVDALERALGEILERHEVLRSRYLTGPEGPEQVIESFTGFHLDVQDISHLAPEIRERQLREMMQEEAATPFDIEQDGVYRIRLVRLADNDHVLLLTIHHIAFDEWSTQVFMRELGMLYNAYSRGEQPNLPPLPIQYADFAWWQRQELQGEKLQTQIDYWRKQLQGAPSLLELPTDHPRPPIQTYHGDTYHHHIPQELAGALEALAEQSGASRFMVLLAAYQVLLYRYTGQDDIVVGAPIANRTHTELEGLIGYFVNVLALRARISHDQTFREFLAQVKQTALQAYDHQDVPFEMLVDELQPVRNLSYTPIFQTVFSMQKPPLRDLKLEDLRLRLLQNEDVTAKFDLSLIVEEAEEGLNCVFEYNTDLFEQETIQRMARHWQHLLEQIARDPDRRLRDISLLSPEEYDLVVRVWNDTTTDYPRDASVQTLFETQVETQPHRPALRLLDEYMTYDELNRQANRLAHFLRAQGVRPGELVGLSVERSFHVVAATLGILKAGAAYLPFDASYPAERVRWMLEDARTRWILSAGEQFALLSQQHEISGEDEGLQIINLDQLPLDEYPDTNPPVLTDGDSLAYVMFTSGSTGRPKGVAVPHRGIVRLVKHTNYLDFRPDDVFLLLAPISFDAATLEIWGPLLNGALLAIIPPGTPSLGELGEMLRYYGVTTLWLTAGLFHRMVEERLEDLLQVERLLSGGDVLSTSHVRKVLEARSEGVMINGYGPTENTTFSTCYPMTSVEDISHFVSIGRPIANSQVYILDEWMQPVPVGVVGEIYLGGDGLALGYLNRPALTSERFLPNPFVEHLQEATGNSIVEPNGADRLTEVRTRLYRTGDLGRWLPDGRIEFLGRRDFQVKVRGFRIELGEIETVLGEHPGVKNVVVMARSDDGGEKRLVAYIIPTDADRPPQPDELRAFLSERLPDYMIPATFVLMDAFPLNPNGKVDRKALPPPDLTAVRSREPHVAPRTPLEAHLARRFAEVLGVEKVGVHDNFFEMGGDSLRGAVLINRLQDDFQDKAPVRAIFLAPTVAKMAAYLQEYFPESVRRFLDADVATEVRYEFEDEIVLPGQRVDEERLRQFRAIIPHLPRRLEEEQLPKNPPAVFILSPPRSGSTLLRVMLAGHPKLFAPPELDLLSFNTLGQRKAAFQGRYAFWLEGLLRAIMELRGVDAEEARAIMAEYERQDMSVKAFYGLMQSWLGERMLVDKTPLYSLDPAILQRMAWDFENARFIHLIRHPYATIYSFIEAKLDALFFRWEHPFTRRELAELIWIAAHRNILDFLKKIPEDRQVRLRYEDLLADPEGQMRRISDFLGVEYIPAMIDPYSEDRMTTGLAPGKQMVGDYKFYLRKKIDPTAATRWRRFHRHDFLSDIARNLAREFGYDDFAPASVPAATKTQPHIPVVPRTSDLPLSFAQQRLWFIDHLEPGTPLYNIPSAVRILGKLDVEAFEAAFQDIVQRHEVLRTTFHTVDGKPQQIIHPTMPLRIRVEDLRGLPPEERLAEAQRRARAFAQQSFDLARGPLLRVRLYQLDQEEHLAVLVIHHIIADGWSYSILIQELGHCYAARREGREPNLPPLPIQYADFAAWQRKWLERPEAQAQIDYWKQTLAPHPTFLNLPIDHPRPPVQTYRGAQISFHLEPELVQRLEALAWEQGATLFMALLAAFHALLHRYSGQDSINIGIPHANRNHSALENLIGFFVNTLVIRADFSDDPTFLELLARVQHAAVEAYAHQEAPFELVVDAVQPDRDPSYSPLFQVMFAYLEDPPQGYRMPGFAMEPVHLDLGLAKFDITLSAVRREGEIRAVFEFNTDLFEAETIQRMIAHFRTLLQSILATPDRPISALTLLTPEELHKVLVDWNQTRTDANLDRCIHQLVAEQAQRTPDAVALVAGSTRLTYRELNERANQLAHFLQELGVGPESLVGVCMDRSEWLVVGLLGILKAGGAYVSLDPAYPKSRLEYMMQVARVSVLVTLDNLLPNLPPSEARVVRLDKDWDVIATRDRTNPPDRAHARNLAYVLFTSGSTGRPKGVAIEHRSAVALIEWAGEVYSAEELAGVLFATSINFDLSVYELFVTLSHGGTVILAENALSLPTLPAAHEVTLINTVPSAIKELLAIQGIPEHVRTVNLAGEPLRAEVVDQLYQHPSIQKVYDLYGPSEDTTYSTWALRQPNGPEIIGRPLSNTRAYILDRNMRPVPVGVPGELYLGGAGLARGYLHQPDQTAARFVPDPFSGEPGARLYRTGDLVRWLPDGNIQFLGRVDYQVKIRGFRIELPEIEVALRSHENISEAVILVREMEGHKQLVAYIVPETSPAPTVRELRAFLQERLPEYMVPALFVVLEKMPLTPNGKINRKALPAPDRFRPQLEAEFVSPQTEMDRVLSDIWQELLHVDRVGIQDNFFELGGDSILAIQMISRAADEGIIITAKQLFQHPTIAGLAAVAKQGQAVQAEQGEVTGEAPLTPIQRWFFEQHFPHPEHWNQSILLDVGQPLDTRLLEQAVAALLRHHDALRMRFRQDDVGGWVQENAPVDETIPFEVIDLVQTPDEALADAITEHCARIQGSLNLAEGPLFRAAYFDLGQGRGWRLFLVAHHLVIDGVSWRILTEDLQRAYLQLAQGQPVQLPRKTTAFIHWARALADYAQTAGMEDDLAFWKRMLAPHVGSLPVDQDAPNMERDLTTLELAISADIPPEADIQSMLLAAFVRSLADWANLAQVRIAVEGHGRELELPGVDISRTVGWFTTLYPLTLDVTSADDIGELAARIRSQARDAAEHAVSYGILRYLLDEPGLEMDAQVSFNYLGRFEGGRSGFAPATEFKGPERHPDNPRPFLIDFAASLVDDELICTWTYNSALLRPQTIQRLASDFNAYLHTLITPASEAVDEELFNELLDELEL